MAGAKPGVHVVQLKPISVPPSLIEGEKFIKYDEDAGTRTPVTLRVDEHGYFLYWTDQNKEVDLLDIATIRDTRTGKCAKIPKDSKFRQNITIGMSPDENLEDRILTVCYGSDFVNVNFLNFFCCSRKEVAKLWTDELLKMAYNLLALNGAIITFLKKAHTKLCLVTDATGKIPVKNIVKMFAQNKDDRKRVEKALDESGLPFGKNDTISPQKFQYEDFFTFYKALTKRAETEKIFNQLCNNSKKKLMTAEQFVEFLNNHQRDPRLNEILYPYANTARAKDLIMQYEPNRYNSQKGQLSFDGFLHYLFSADNMIVTPDKFDHSEDMDQPLAHYFINSSHNTYLTGHQLTGKSSVEIYRQCLLSGCRCVELDFWNGGRSDEPVIVHGYTLVPEINAKEVIEAIAESAFKTSEYPVILSFENHCNPRQQAKIAQYCRDFFGDTLLEKPLEGYPLEPGNPLPPPSALKRKIIIKNKKKHHHSHHHPRAASTKGSSAEDEALGAAAGGDQPAAASQEGIQSPPVIQGNGEVPHPPPLTKEQSKESIDEDDMENDESSSDEDVESMSMDLKNQTDKGTAGKESEAGAEISALVNYVQPVHFYGFDVAEKRNRCTEMSSFDERQATMLLKESPVEFVNYNKNQLSRVYPRGTRVDSSNFMPQVFWNAGCELVALNFQTLDLAMQLNIGNFEYNGRCGYLLKPEFMRRKDRRFDPFAESTVDGIIAGTVSVQVISAQFLTDKRVGTYVEVDMYGLPADTVRKKFRTKIIPNNGINPVYDEDPFVFKKVVLPDLACLRVAAFEESGKALGSRILPVVGLCPGYRHIAMRNESGQSLMLPSVFVHIIVKDYVPDGMSDFAEALANPIKYQSELEKRSQQLKVLLADENEEANDEESGLQRTQSVHQKKPSEVQVTGSGSPHLSDSGSGKGVASPSVTAKSNTTATVPALANSLMRCSLESGGSLVTGGVNTSASGGGSSNTIEETSKAGAEGDTNAVRSMSGSIDAAMFGERLKGNAAKSTLQTQTSNGESSLDRPGTTSPLLESSAKELATKPLESFLEHKSVREKRAEFEKKLEQLRKKNEKERSRLQEITADPEKAKTKLQKTHSKLVKKLSSKNISVSLTTREVSVEGGGDSSDGEAKTTNSTGVPADPAAVLRVLSQEHLLAEKELREKFHETFYSAVEKVLRSSQCNQLKLLQGLQEKEVAETMKRIGALQRDEFKTLAKKYKDKDELARMKREVSNSVVEKGVQEREKLSDLYRIRKEEMEREHEDVRTKLEDWKTKADEQLRQDLDERCNQLELEVQKLASSTASASQRL